jgi:hypothetical protein
MLTITAAIVLAALILAYLDAILALGLALILCVLAGLAVAGVMWWGGPTVVLGAMTAGVGSLFVRGIIRLRRDPSLNTAQRVFGALACLLILGVPTGLGLWATASVAL